MEKESGYILFGYRFGWNGLSMYKGKKVDGARVDVVVHIYKEGKEVLLSDEPLPYADIYFSDIFTVSYCPKKGVLLEMNPNISELFQILWGYDDIQAEIAGYHLESHLPLIEKKVQDYIPAKYRYEALSQYEEVSEDEFMTFLLENADKHCLQKGEEACVGMAKVVPVVKEKADDFAKEKDSQ